MEIQRILSESLVPKKSASKSLNLWKYVLLQILPLATKYLQLLRDIYYKQGSERRDLHLQIRQIHHPLPTPNRSLHQKKIQWSQATLGKQVVHDCEDTLP